ncbi:gp16 family protein [Salinisphaera orenii]|uniref:Regulatory protein GemA n=1 Tax=Salinisphaera orenii YIM 95161 TaxID=1051139 RepID=A0A423PRP4_9GAMM|nr:regulatory protein GemA [Salinisphaera halophila]ROO28232.1 hypothetical protein SAHL_10745 [Salinisphaera halophila YIM 95161]
MSTRNATLAKIHIAKKDLALDDAVYREILWTVARVRSAKDLDAHGRDAVLSHFRSRGWKPKVAKRAGKVPHNRDREPMLRKIEALLTDQGLPWSYADAIAQQMFSVERLAWLRDEQQLRAVIAALDKRRRRIPDRGPEPPAA